MEYFDLEGTDLRISTSASTVEKVVAGTEIQLVSGRNTIPFEMELFKISFEGGRLNKSRDFTGVKVIWQDYLPNQFAWPMMSARMHEIIKNHLTGQEGIDWITAPIHGNGETMEYFIPRFSRVLDILDPELTTFTARGVVVRPWVSKEKAKGFAMFSFPQVGWEITPALIIHEPLMKELKKAKLSGIAFSPARSS